MGVHCSTASLRLPMSAVETLVRGYHQYHTPLVVDRMGLLLLFTTDLKRDQTSIVDELFALTKIDTVCYTQEAICILILISDCDWKCRSALVFDLFKCIGLDELNHEDFLIIGNVIGVALHRLWKEELWNREFLTSASERITDDLFVKADKDIGDGIDKSAFVNWITKRFPDSLIVSNSESLRLQYSA